MNLPNLSSSTFSLLHHLYHCLDLHSTETTMVGIADDVLADFDEEKCTVMVFLDLSAAFDTIDIRELG